MPKNSPVIVKKILTKALIYFLKVNYRSLFIFKVWIYGGGFASGTSTLDIYDPKILVAETQLIYVSIQYRLNIFGFLYMDNENAPGNQVVTFESRLNHFFLIIENFIFQGSFGSTNGSFMDP